MKNAKTQFEKFREAAKENNSDESEEAFDRNLRRVANTPPKSENQPTKPGKAQK